MSRASGGGDHSPWSEIHPHPHLPTHTHSRSNHASFPDTPPPHPLPFAVPFPEPAICIHRRKKFFFHLFEGFFICWTSPHPLPPVEEEKIFFKTHNRTRTQGGCGWESGGDISLRLERTEGTGTQISTYSIFALISFLFRQETPGSGQPSNHPTVHHPLGGSLCPIQSHPIPSPNQSPFHLPARR